MKLVSWISPDILYHQMLYFNPNSLDYLEEQNIYVEWSILSANPGAIKYLQKDPTLLHKGIWFKNTNPAVIPLIENSEYINNPWIQEQLLENPNALHLIDHKFIRNNLYKLCKNTNPLAIDLIEYYIDENVSDNIWDMIGKNSSASKLIHKYLHKMSWKCLSENPSVIDILLLNPHHINWATFSKNTHPLAIQHLRKNLDKVDWVYLNMNPAAIEILKENQDKINGYWISCNPAIFEYDYLKMAKEKMDILRDELLSSSLHPSRISAWLKQGLTLADI